MTYYLFKAMLSFSFTLFIFGGLCIAGAKDYCNIKNCKKNEHTMCHYNTTAISGKCKTLLSNHLTPQEKNMLLQSHNKYRQLVASGNETRGKSGPQPAAKEMPNLIWDDELEAVAQRWANQLEFKHDKCRNVERFGVGQNVVELDHTNPKNSSLEVFVKIWYDEVRFYNHSNLQHFRVENQTGHYTQMVWAKTTRLGCGILRCTVNKQKIWYNEFLVCNYAPAGNVIGGTVYVPKEKPNPHPVYHPVKTTVNPHVSKTTIASNSMKPKKPNCGLSIVPPYENMIALFVSVLVLIY